MNKEIKLVIRVKDSEIATGHRNHISGCGAHKDKRTKRNRTRNVQRRKAIVEFV